MSALTKFSDTASPALAPIWAAGEAAGVVCAATGADATETVSSESEKSEAVRVWVFIVFAS